MAFQEKDAEFFFGRETFVDGLVRVVQQQPLVAVIGSSGSGKSSVVLAGLIPKLREAGSWLIESFRPNRQPFYELAAALISQLEPELGKTDKTIKAKELAQSIRKHGFTADVSAILKENPEKRLLLVIDQFEELYTGCADTEQPQFVDALLAVVESASHAVTLMLTLRADFYSYVVNYPPFGEALNKYPAKNITLMKAQEMQKAIELPAEKKGVKLEAGLTQLILKDVMQEPGNLPLLEFALTQLWDKQSRGLLTHQAYSEIGGVAKALSNHAEAVYGKLSKVKQKQARRIFLQLVRPGEGTEDTRRVAALGEVGTWDLVTFLAGEDARLVVTGRNEQTGEETVEVVHEALIQEWKRLQDWIEADRDFRTWQERLREAMQEWQSNKKQEGYLLHGARLAVAEEKLHEREDEISPQEQDFINRSLVLRDQEKAKRERQELETLKAQAARKTAEKEKQILHAANQQAEQKLHEANQQAKWITMVALAVLLIAIVIGVFAYVAFQKQQEAVKVTQLEQKVATAFQNFENTPLDALALAIESGKELKNLVKDSLSLQKYSTVSPLLALQTILDNINQQNQFDTQQIGINAVIFGKDKAEIFTAGEDGTVKQFDFSSKELLTIKNAHEGGVNSVRFSSPTNKLATGGKDGTAKLWDISSPEKLLVTFKGHQWNPQDEKKPRAQRRRGVQNVRFPNGTAQILATSGDDGTLRLWNFQGQELSKVVAHKDSIESINFSPDNKLIATVAKDRVAKLWQLNGNQINKTPVAEFKGHTDSVNSIDFSKKSNFLATAGDDGKVRLWDFQGKELQEFTADFGSVKVVRFSEKDEFLATASADGTVRLWSLTSKNDVKLFDVELFAEFKKVHQGKIESIRFREDGERIVSSGADDSMVKIWKVPKKQFVQLNGHKGSVNSVRFSPDSNYLATAGDDNKVILWKRNKNEFDEFNTFPHPSKVNSVRFSPKKGDELLATAGEDGQVRLWNFNHKDKSWLRCKTVPNSSIKSMNFSPDGELLATGGEDGKVILWTRNEKCLRQFLFSPPNHQNAVEDVRFSPDGKLLAAVGKGGTAWLWDIQNQRKVKLNDRQNDYKGIVYDVSFSQDGKEVFTAGDDGTIRRWDLNGKQLQPEVKADQTGVRNISFSKDGSLLATVGAGGTVKLWTSSGKQVAKFEGHQGIVKSAAFSDDGKWLVTGGDDHTAIVWHVRNLDELLEEGCTRLEDYLPTQKDRKELKNFCDSK